MPLLKARYKAKYSSIIRNVSSTLYAALIHVRTCAFGTFARLLLNAATFLFLCFLALLEIIESAMDKH